MKLKGLFLNTSNAQCSIYESGKMVYDCLKLSKLYSIDYKEIDKYSRTISTDYDFYVFNYHISTMDWLETKFIRNLPGFKSTIVLEVAPNDPFVMCPKDDFNAYLVLDPTLKSINPNVYTFPRPIELGNELPEYIEKEIPVIGTFGFATEGKGFDKVIYAVNKEFEKAILKINIPEGSYVSKTSFDKLIREIREIPTKKDIEVFITNDYFDKSDLIKWCSQNTINVFLYDRCMQGLAATTDQAISSGRPLAISTNNTFRHIHEYITPYPFQSLKDSIKNSQKKVLEIQNDWNPLNFAFKFEKILKNQKFKNLNRKIGSLKLPLKNEGSIQKTIKKIHLSDFIPPILYKLKHKILRISETQRAYKINTLQPSISYVLNSFSQFGEDLLIDLLLNHRNNGFFVDIGANDPIFNSNTMRFYLRGWKGINIEPNFSAFEKLKEIRINDINLNIAISEKLEELSFYCLSNDTTLSTLNYSNALKMSKLLNLEITEHKVETVPIKNIFEKHLNNKTIDFMSVDAEGNNLSVLKSNDWEKYRPTIILIECNDEFEQIRSYLDKNDYLHLYNNRYNAIFINKNTNDINVLENISWSVQRK
jgi:FkbM family methyltransferase